MKDEDDRRPKPPARHEIGCDLSGISVDELRERVVLLEDEVARLKADQSKKLASRNAAASVFKT